MKMDLRRPCPNCPFRTDIRPFLSAARAEEIVLAITEQQQTFQCHKTVHYMEDEDGEETHSQTPDDQHCAGALIMLEKMEQPNQWMRIAERLGCYDRTKLHMESPVYDDGEQMIEAHAVER